MTRIQLRRDTAANWESVNPVLAEGEIGIDLTNNKFKIGNGTDNYTNLPYAAGDAQTLTAISPVEITSGNAIRINVGSGLEVQNNELVNSSYSKAEVDALLNDKQDLLSAGNGIAISSGLAVLPNDFISDSPLITCDGVESGYEAYKAFDGDPSTYWGGDDSNEHWIIRQHNSIIVKAVSMSFREATEIFTQGEIQGSNDGSTFTTLATYTNSELSITVDCSSNTTAYTYTRITGTPASGWGKVGEINIRYEADAAVSVNHTDDFIIEDGKLALGDVNPNYKYSNIESPLTLIEEEGVPYKSAIIDSTNNTFSLSGSATTDSMSKQATSLALQTDSDMRIDKTKMITSSFHTQAEVSEYTDSYVYTNSVADMSGNRFNVFMRTPILGYTQPNGVFIPVLYTSGGTIYEVTGVSNMAYDSTTGLTTYTLTTNDVGSIDSSLLNYNECDMVTLQLKDRNDNIVGFRIQFTKCLNGSQTEYANTVTTSTTPYATLLSKINTVVYPCHCNVNYTGSTSMGNIGINTVAEYGQAIYYTPTPLRTVKDFGIKSTKLGLAYDTNYFQVDSTGKLTLSSSVITSNNITYNASSHSLNFGDVA